MHTINLTVLILSLIATSPVYGYIEGFFGVVETNYTIKDIESFNITETTDSFYCPIESSFSTVTEFVTRDSEKFTTCDYQYLCNQKSEKCVLFSAPTGLGTYEYINDNTQGKAYDVYGKKEDKLILVGCSEKRFKKKACHTDICKKNEDCFSDNCVNGVCMTNESNPITLCRPVKEGSEINVKCLKSFEEKCTDNKECGDNANCSNSKVCAILEYDTKEYNITLFIILGLVVVIIIAILACVISKRRSK